MSWQECLARARAGDPAARECLFSTCRSYLRVIARTSVEPWLQAKVDASDLVQQTLLDAHRDFDRFLGTSDQEWLAWLRQILSHNACDAARHYGAAGKRQARREIPLVDPGDSQPGLEPAAGDASPSQLALHHEKELMLAIAIDQLPADYREVVLLRNIQRLPFDEVAARLERTRPAAQMLWMRAIQKLKSLLPAALGDGGSRG